MMEEKDAEKRGGGRKANKLEEGARRGRGGGWPNWHQPPERKPRSHRNSGGPRQPQINGIGYGAIMGFPAAGSLLNSLFWFTLD